MGKTGKSIASSNYKKLSEESLKIAVRDDYFAKYDYRQIGRIDFVIAKYNVESSLFRDEIQGQIINNNLKSILWAEAKQGTTHDIFESFVQLILTIGKEKTFEKYLPPKYIGAFDAEKFAFIEYHKIQEVFYQNDFNWNVTPSNHETKEFKQLHSLCESILQENSILFRYDTQNSELKEFIKLNFKTDKDVSEKISVTRNNFVFVFQEWCKVVKPTLEAKDDDWKEFYNALKVTIADFFLADLLSSNNKSIKENLKVVLQENNYIVQKIKINESLINYLSNLTIKFNDNQKKHKEFWSIYERPPREEYWDFIIERKDLLVPVDIRERKGSYFTTQIWVQKSQEYLSYVLGDNWQDEYYIWDCCAGTGNMLNGLTNKRNIWASTLDDSDVAIMKELALKNDNLYENHIFQFDFLNDDFTKCPEELQYILNDEEKRKKLVIYINPPYAEAANAKTVSGTGDNKSEVSNTTKIWNSYINSLGKSARELFVQFFVRIFCELNGCILGEFSKLKMIQSPNFKDVRKIFKAKLQKTFLAPAESFDNVKGQFPIGFFVWDTGISEEIKTSQADIYDIDGNFLGQKSMVCYGDERTINEWLKNYIDEKDEIGAMCCVGTDFQHKNYVNIAHKNELKGVGNAKGIAKFSITRNNIIASFMYFSVRQSVESTWLNDRDQFLYPTNGWQTDREFQSDCLIYTLFHGQNRISSDQGINYWIPFTEQQVGCRKSFKSNFMSKFISDFLAGKVFLENDALFDSESGNSAAGRVAAFSSEAQFVYDAGLKLWRYYHSQKNANPDASFYDIRKYFQGEKNGKMNLKSDDEYYMELITELRYAMKALAKKIEPKVYEYGFLK